MTNISIVILSAAKKPKRPTRNTRNHRIDTVTETRRKSIVEEIPMEWAIRLFGHSDPTNFTTGCAIFRGAPAASLPGRRFAAQHIAGRTLSRLGYRRRGGSAQAGTPACRQAGRPLRSPA